MAHRISRSGFLSLFAAPQKTTNENPPAKRLAASGVHMYEGEWGSRQVSHLLRRCLLGATIDDIRSFSGKSLSQCLDILLTPSPAPQPPLNYYNEAAYTDPDVPYGKTWVYSAFGDPDSEADRRRVDSLKAWWVGLMINQDRSLTEKMTLFWSNHVAAQMYLMKDARLDYEYLQAIRSYAMGNFKKLIRDITTNPGMMEYLNTNVNTAAAPNENYSRELQELFTVGKGPGSHYTEQDVREAARILTGWETEDRPGGVFTVFKPQNHDSGDKKFSSFYGNTIIQGQQGTRGAKEVDTLVDMIFAQREVARHLCRRLYRWFVYSDIDLHTEQAVIEPLSDVLIDSHFEISPVLRALLSSEHFYDPLNMGCQIKSPIDHLIGAYRQLKPADDDASPEMRYKQWLSLSWKLSEMGMNPGDPLSVSGWPAYYQSPSYNQSWISTSTLAMRNAATDALVSLHGMDCPGSRLHFDLIGFARQLPNPSDPNALIADSCTHLCAVELSAGQAKTLKQILLSGQSADHYWTTAWQEYADHPDDEVKKNTILSRLIPFFTYILQRPEYQLA